MKKLLFLFLLQVPSMCLGAPSPEFISNVKDRIESYAKGNQDPVVDSLLQDTFLKFYSEDEVKLASKIGVKELWFLRFCCFLQSKMNYRLYIGNFQNSSDALNHSFAFDKKNDECVIITCMDRGRSSKLCNYRLHPLMIFLNKSKYAQGTEPHAARELFEKFVRTFENDDIINYPEFLNNFEHNFTKSLNHDAVIYQYFIQ